ncbi:MAG: MucB/RseB C-terminal domain-containing protein [Methylotenera sp.]|nr:MucB/RseB C-terminal domain-containing protein [Methylotenera sp.]MDP2231192.1 MucB/RseB C-terminal domain-containing protein [Methylotenera sp.]MDP3140081.1 MucB/RseB C-terminal domain-containing protein [Methylotenera sp.]
MPMKRFVLACLLVGVTLSAKAANDEDGWQILQKAAVAARALSYQGIFICQSGQNTKSVQIKHYFDGQNEFGHNVVLDGSPREVLSQGGDLVIYNQKNEKIVIEKRRGQNMFPAILPTNLDLVKVSYSVRTGDTERVANREALILFLEPKDNLRYSYRFWIDKEYGLILKSVMFNGRNQMMDSIAFNQLNLLNTVDLDWFKPRIDSKKSYVMEDEVPTKADNNVSPHWTLKELPAGYRKVDQMIRMVHGKSFPVTHVIFSDGLASVSLFIEPIAKGVKPRSGNRVVGNTSFYSSVAGYLQITALGEVPEATVAQIANAVVFIK